MLSTQKLCLILVLTYSVATSCSRHAPAAPKFTPVPLFVSDNPQSIYAGDPNDAWNRIFRALFTRTVKRRVSDAFSQGARLTQFRSAMGPISLRISTEKLTETELGDRAIEPLYPTFLTVNGPLKVLFEPLFTELTVAITQAIAETKQRSPIERALMQSDVWAAYDSIYGTESALRNRDVEILERRAKALSLLRQFIRKLALSTEEIASLNSNYLIAVNAGKLPNLFSMDTGWLEIELLPFRLHDHAAGYRRAARVFVKPRKPTSDPEQFVESLKQNKHHDEIEAVGLIVQNLLIDKSGRVVASPLVSDVQFRFFRNDKTGTVSAEPKQFELSRRKLLTEPSSGGFVEFSASSAAYLSSAGNDYDFATPIEEADAPVLVPLQTRCTQCHNSSLTTLMTYSIHDVPPVPKVRILKPSDQDRAFYVARRKEEREDFKSLFLDH